MNNGFFNEKQLKNYINGNSFKTYNSNIKSFLLFLFGSNINANMPFSAEQTGGRNKPDICISHNNINKYISIKKGSGNSVHQEKIDVFFPFIENLINEKTLNNLKLFHYGDGTLDDTGVTRYSSRESRSKFSKEVRELNIEINKWKYLCIFLDRFLFKGNNTSTIVDAIYHGTITEGVWASKSEIKEYIKNNSFETDAVHFGPLTYQVWGRNENRTAVHPDRRYVMQVKWQSITSDLNNIRKENNYV